MDLNNWRRDIARILLMSKDLSGVVLLALHVVVVDDGY